MYCRKCGKWVDDNVELCAACQETDEFFSDKSSREADEFFSRGNEQANAFFQTTAQTAPQGGSRKEGFAKALTAAILSVVASFLAGMAAGFIMAALEELDGSYYYYQYDTVKGVLTELNLYGATVFCIVAAIGLSIPGLILGIQSIACFKRASRAGRVKPIATLILGIAGVVCAAEGILFALISMAGLAA